MGQDGDHDTHLIHSVSKFVCRTFDESKIIGVLKEFKIWYAIEFELQRQSNNNDAVLRGAVPCPKDTL